ncbi:MAG TPA: aldose epimerase family protein, partial [Flavisolibacter sp.]
SRGFMGSVPGCVHVAALLLHDRECAIARYLHAMARITSHPFGAVNGQDIIEYTLINDTGMQASIIGYGAAITKIEVPDRDGILGNVVLGFHNIEGYLQDNNPYFGSIVGRYANRIARARFNIDGEEYSLSANHQGHTLHGGFHGLDKHTWDVEETDDGALRCTTNSMNGSEGFPGNLAVEVVYSWEEDRLRIDYRAVTDKATPVNLTNHSYFNLSAGQEPDILSHLLYINADRYTETDSELIPTGRLLEVKDTPLDFTQEKPIGSDISIPGGYDHNYVLRGWTGALQLAARAWHQPSGRCMEVFTTTPGIQLYTAGFAEGDLQHTNGHYGSNAAFCLETQHFPDSPNHANFPGTILRPGETYRQSTVYSFSIQ